MEKIYSKIIKKIKDYISYDFNLNKKFNHYNQKYSMDDLLNAIIIIMKKGIKYRDISIYCNINWNTVYKFKMKLVRYNIMELVYKNIINDYLMELNEPTKILYTDTSLIINNLGVDMIAYNPQLKKHKTTKISIITDAFNVPVNINVFNSNINDALIIYTQLDDVYTNTQQLCNNDTIFIGDAAYDSNKIRNKIEELKMGQLLTGNNNRNTKNINLINGRKHKLKERMLLKTRINIEHTINEYKKCKRIKIREDKYIKNYKSYLYLATIYIVIKQANLY